MRPETGAQGAVWHCRYGGFMIATASYSVGGQGTGELLDQTAMVAQYLNQSRSAIGDAEIAARCASAFYGIVSREALVAVQTLPEAAGFLMAAYPYLVTSFEPGVRFSASTFRDPEDVTGEAILLVTIHTALTVG